MSKIKILSIECMDFNNPKLVHKHGSWVRVQVAFSDFLYERSQPLTAEQFAARALKAAAGFHDGCDFYEDAIAIIEGEFSNPETAWCEFLDYCFPDYMGD